MLKKHLLLIFSVGLLAGSCTVFWNSMIDATLVPRVFFAAAWLLLFSPFIYRLFSDRPLEFDIADLFFGTYVLLHLVSIVQAINKPEAYYETAKMFIVFCCYIVFKQVLNKKLFPPEHLLKVLIFVCAAYFFYALLQFNNLLAYAKPEGDNLYAITGFCGHKNLYSGFMFITSCLLGVLALRVNGAWRYASIIVMGLQLVMIFMLQTRSVFLAVLVAIMVIAVGIFLMGEKVLSMAKKGALPAVGVILLVIMFFYLNGTLHSLVNRLNVSNYLKSDTSIERLTVWYKSSLLLADHWLLGVGARNWAIFYPKYSLSGMFRPQYLNTVFLEPHNDFLWVWCELGILGLLAFLGLFGAFVFALVNKLRCGAFDLKNKYVLLLLLAQQLGFLVFSFFDFPKERIEHQVLLVFSWALISYFAAAQLKTFKLPAALTRPFLYISFVLLIVGTVIMTARLQGEYYVRPMLAAEQTNDSKTMLELARVSNNAFSTLTPLSVPKKWYEGLAAYAMGDNQLAYNCFLEAKQQSPYNHHVLNNLGGMETLFQRYDEAFKNYNEALRINPRNDDSRFNIAYTLYILKRYNEALDTLQAIKTNPEKRQQFINVISDAKQADTSVVK